MPVLPEPGPPKTAKLEFTDSYCRKGCGAIKLPLRSDAPPCLDEAAVPPLALLKVEQRFIKLRGCEIGPQRFGHINLGVCNLPEQKIADAHFAAGADQ